MALGLSGGVYFWGALALGVAFLVASAAFALSFSSTSARRLLLASVIYLPALLLVMVADSLL